MNGSTDLRKRRHPRGLATLVLAELWERFSLYGMVAILVHFLAASRGHGDLGLPAGTAEAVEGAYMAMISLLALPGGWIADRFLGARRAVLWGGAVIMAGHLLMAFPQAALDRGGRGDGVLHPPAEAPDRRGGGGGGGTARPAVAAA